MRGRRLGRRVGSARPAPWAGCDQWPAETPPLPCPSPLRRTALGIPQAPAGRGSRWFPVRVAAGRGRLDVPAAGQDAPQLPPARDLLALPGLLSAR